jgi:hypothetical protein
MTLLVVVVMGKCGSGIGAQEFSRQRGMTWFNVSQKDLEV